MRSIIVINENKEEKDINKDWKMVEDPTGDDLSFVMRFTSFPIAQRKENVLNFFKNKVKILIDGKEDKYFGFNIVTPIFGGSVDTGVKVKLEVMPVSEPVNEPATEPVRNTFNANKNKHKDNKKEYIKEASYEASNDVTEGPIYDV